MDQKTVQNNKPTNINNKKPYVKKPNTSIKIANLKLNKRIDKLLEQINSSSSFSHLKLYIFFQSNIYL